MAGKAATVLIPTHTHAETLRHSVPSALAQTVTDIEVFIIGDGVPDSTRAIVHELAARDARIRFFDLPKGPSRGEVYRHHVLQEAAGEIICYLFDDDLWLPDHVAVMQALLRDADLALTMPVIVQPDGRLDVWYLDLSKAIHRRLFTDSRSQTPAIPTCVAHTAAAYRRLPHGWRTTPAGAAPDKFMWAQFLDEPGCVARSSSHPTSLVFRDPPRRDWPMPRRLSELESWSARLGEP
ncbi:MAG TPA: glycosyltransferase family 2 protein, partial [Thermoanaerobaculia bacterium]|nr:glycosyltransferase family 2 protein [Thermoanaerobaculia bacterium]